MTKQEANRIALHVIVWATFVLIFFVFSGCNTYPRHTRKEWKQELMLRDAQRNAQKEAIRKLTSTPTHAPNR